jgi:phage-related protein
MSGQAVVVSVLADTAKFRGGMADAGKSASGFGTAIKGIGLGVAALGVGAAVGIGKLVKDSIAAASESEKVAAQTAAVVKSTGGAAGRSADQIGALATKLSEMTGIDDEVVQSGENIIATFGNIKGDNFDRTTKAALDMSVAMGTDVNSAALTLGKALNDPLNGLTKLQKQGVTFTAQQKDQVKAMVAAGDAAGAQSLILNEVSKEFGGSAEAFGNTLSGIKAKIGNAFGNIEETIGGAFLPVLEAAGSKLAGFLQRLGDFDKFASFINKIADGIGTLVSGTSGPLGQFVSTLIKAATAASPLGNVLKFVGDNANKVGPILETVAKVITGALAAALPIVVQLIGALAQTFAAILPAVAQLAQTLGGALVQVILALAPLLVLVAQTLGQLLPIVAPLIVALLQLITPIIALIGPLLTPLIQLLVLLLKPILALASGILGLLIPVLTFLIKGFAAVVTFIAGGLKPAIQGLIGFFAGNFAGSIRTLGAIWSTVWNGIKAVFQLQVSIVRAGVSALVGFFSGVWGSITRGISGFASGVSAGIGRVVGFVTSIPGRVRGAIGNLGGLLADQGRNIIQGLVNGISGSLGAISNIASRIGSKLVDGVKGFLGIHSPSREMAKLGVFAVQGLANGLGNLKPVTSAALALSDAVTSGFDPDLSADAAFSTSGRLRGGDTYVIHLSTLNPSVETGRVIAQSLNDYQRLNGARA